MKNYFRKKSFCLFAAVSMSLLFFKQAYSKEQKLLISEIQITAGAGKTNEDFIEIYNPTQEAILLDGYKLHKKTKTGSESSIKVFDEKDIIPAKGYFLWINSSLEKIVDDYDEKTTATIASDNSIALLDGEDKVVDGVGWGNMEFNSFAEKNSFPLNPLGGQSLIRKKEDGSYIDGDDNSSDFEISNNPSSKASGCRNNPEKIQCKIVEEKPQEKSISNIVAGDIRINEVLPNPTNGEEFIELFNGDIGDVDLFGWILRDASKTGKFEFVDHVTLKSKEYYVIYKNKFKFALNNSGNESVVLFDPNGNEISKVDYNGSKKDLSYNFDGKKWRWSKFLTPGLENIFNNLPKYQIDYDKKVFTDIYADFSVKAKDKDGDKIKVTWDFGDGHKSYLAKTKHKYEKEGKYEASVKISDGNEDIVDNFKIEVEDYPQRKVKIISINANPKGKDSDFESISLENKSKKKVNLKGWSIATGWKKLANHPISEDFEIPAGKTKEITRQFSKFTLNNKQSKIELRYPNGEVASKAKYKVDKSIGEDAKFVKERKQWVLKSPIIKTRKSNNNQEINSKIQINYNDQKTSQDTIINNQEVNDVQKPIIKKQNQVKFVAENKIELALEEKVGKKMVLGAEIVRITDDKYLFTPETQEKEHYAVVFFKDIFSNINEKLNKFIDSL